MRYLLKYKWLVGTFILPYFPYLGLRNFEGVNTTNAKISRYLYKEKLI